jgi:hypothetical protein
LEFLMLVVETEHGPGVIGFTGQESARYHQFTAAWAMVNVPMDTKHFPGLGYDTACNSNAIIEHMVKDPAMQFAWIMDDDHVFGPDVLINLLDNHVDLVVPLYAQRQAPFRPCIYKEHNADGSYTIHDWKDLEGKSGLLPIVSAGKGGVLIRRPVIEAIARPWFEWKIIPGQAVGEDHRFFEKCRDAGFQPYVDLDTRLVHITSVFVRPNEKNGLWCAAVDLGGNPPAVLEYWDKAYQGRV